MGVSEIRRVSVPPCSYENVAEKETALERRDIFFVFSACSLRVPLARRASEIRVTYVMIQRII